MPDRHGAKIPSGYRAPLLLSLMLAGSALRPAQQLPVKTYTTADGLSSDRAICITEDDSGRIYVGTRRDTCLKFVLPF